MSKAVLEQLGGGLRVAGMPWLRPGETLDTSVNSLTAKILCKRHNEALSPLDEEAARFFSTLRSAVIDLERKTLSRKPIVHLAGGEALELWMLKVACGLYFAVGSENGVRLAETHTIDISKVQRAFFESKWDPQAGLYFKGSTGTKIEVKNTVGMAPITTTTEQRFCGTVISLVGFELQLVFDTRNINSSAWTGIVRHPTELVLTKKLRRHSFMLTWPPGTPDKSVIMGDRPPPPSKAR